VFQLRPASQADFSQIRALIHTVKINPTGLDWRRFWVAVDPSNEIIGCGQVKTHRDGSQELASIAVDQNWRGRSVARALITQLITLHTGTLYLTCRASLGCLYQKFGFKTVNKKDMPPYFKRLHWIASLFNKLRWMHEGLLIMVYDKPSIN
jgi:N-acetylglutamate synthase-like GNAT family acetyltransferase